MENVLDIAYKRYERVVLMGDHNVDLLIQNNERNILLDFCDAFDLKNIIQDTTCHVGDSKTLIDHIFTNKHRSCLTKGLLNNGMARHKWSRTGGILNWSKYKHDRNKSTHIRRVSIKGYFHDKCNKGSPQTMSFWKTIKLFLSKIVFTVVGNYYCTG